MNDLITPLTLLTGFLVTTPMHATPGEIEILTDRLNYTEGPAITDDGQAVFFTEAGPAHAIHLHRVGQHGAEVAVDKEQSGGANGMLVKDGRLYVCEDRLARRVSYWTLDENHQPVERTVLAERVDGKRFNGPNDLAVDEHGGVYFSDPNFAKSKDGPGVEHVYYIAPGGDAVSVVSNLARPNGVLLSPDEQKLYVADSRGKCIWAYDLDQPGELSNGRELFDTERYGVPDGMTVLSDGTVIAAIFQGYLLAISPEGELIWELATGDKTSNVVVSPEQSTLYFTSEHRLKSAALEPAKSD